MMRALQAGQPSANGSAAYRLVVAIEGIAEAQKLLHRRA
jgi:hypothetical protein